jgi:uncharacterized membrane protein YkvI
MVFLLESQSVGEGGHRGGSQTEDIHTMNTWTGNARFALLIVLTCLMRRFSRPIPVHCVVLPSMLAVNCDGLYEKSEVPGEVRVGK